MDEKNVSVILKIKKGKSKKGNDYCLAEITFENGYTLPVFLNSEQEFILNQI